MTYVGFRALAWGLERTGAFETDEAFVRGSYDLCTLATLTMLVLVLVVFVAANLL